MNTLNHKQKDSAESVLATNITLLRVTKVRLVREKYFIFQRKFSFKNEKTKTRLVAFLFNNFQ